MKNKTKTYILLSLVLAIWGIIGYKIVATVNPDTNAPVQDNFNVAFNPKTNTEIDTFSVKTANRDPFLGTLLVKKTPIKKTKKVTVKKNEWVPVVYNGIVSNKNTTNKVYVVSINNKQYLMKLGQEFNGIKLIKGNNTEITVSYKGERKTVLKT